MTRITDTLMEGLRKFVYESFSFRGGDPAARTRPVTSGGSSPGSGAGDSGGEKNVSESDSDGREYGDGSSRVDITDDWSSSDNSSDNSQLVIVNTNSKSREIKTDPSCLSISVYSAVVIAFICIFLVLGRDYIKYVLFHLEKANLCISLAVFLLLFIAVSFPMTWGYILLNIAAGYMYGLIIGIGVVMICALTGILVAHAVIRRCLRDCVVAKFSNDYVRSIVNLVEGDEGYKVVAWARLTPIPFGLQNALFAISGIKTPPYLLASMLGMLPSQGMHSYIGSSLRSMEEVFSDGSSNTMTYFVFGGQLLLALALLLFVVRKARMEFHKMINMRQSSSNHGNAKCQMMPASSDADPVCCIVDGSKVKPVGLVLSSSAGGKSLEKATSNAS